MPTATQFAADALGLLPFDPPPPARGRAVPRSTSCWLCGGSAGDNPWHQASAIAPTFTQHNTAARPGSDAVCQSCAALTRAETFQALVSRRGLPLKLWAQAGWHSYSHHLRADGHYQAPTPARMRAILIDPPPGRWLLAVNTTGQKHTIFRATVASSPAHYPVQVDETTVWIRRTELLACLVAFERLTALGCGKEGVATGAYHPADTARAGLARWWPAEQEMADWRARAPQLVALVRMVARSAKALQEAA